MYDIILTEEQCIDLHNRGSRYLRVVGCPLEEIDNCLSRAFVKLCTSLVCIVPEEQPMFADNTWRVIILQAITDNYRAGVIKDGKLSPERCTADCSEEYEIKDFVHKLLFGVFELLTDDDIIVLLALVDNNLSMTATAKYFGEQRTNIYPIVRRIRAKILTAYPQGTLVKTRGLSQKYVEKTRDWSRFLMAVEVVEYREYGAALFDKSEVCVPPIKTQTAKGLVPGSTPTVRQLSLGDWEKEQKFYLQT